MSGLWMAVAVALLAFALVLFVMLASNAKRGAGVNLWWTLVMCLLFGGVTWILLVQLGVAK